MKTFVAKATAREFYMATIVAETEEEAWEKAEALPFDEWEKDEDAVYATSPNYQFEVNYIEED